LRVAVKENTNRIKRQVEIMQEVVGCILNMSQTIANLGTKTDRPDQDRSPRRQENRRPTVLTADCFLMMTENQTDTITKRICGQNTPDCSL